MVTYSRLFWLKSDGQRFRKVSRKLLVESAADRILWCQRTVDIAVHGQETCDTSHQPLSRGDSIRHGERDPVATDFVSVDTGMMIPLLRKWRVKSVWSLSRE